MADRLPDRRVYRNIWTGSQHIKGNHNIYVRLTRHSAGEIVETNH